MVCLSTMVLIVVNVGDSPSFVNVRRRKFLDITGCMASVARRIRLFRVFPHRRFVSVWRARRWYKFTVTLVTSTGPNTVTLRNRTWTAAP